MPFAGIAFLWFIAVMRDRLGKMEDRFFATVLLGSGLLYIAMFFAAGAIAGGLIRVLTAGTENLVTTGRSPRHASWRLIRIVSYRTARNASKPTAFVLETVLNESCSVALAASLRLPLRCIHKSRREEEQLAAPNSIA